MFLPLHVWLSVVGCRVRANVRAEDAQLQYESFFFHALLQLADLFRADVGGRVCDLHQHRLELVEEGGHLLLSAILSGASVESIAREQRPGALALIADVDVAARRQVRQLDEDALGLIEVVADEDEEDAVADLLLLLCGNSC